MLNENIKSLRLSYNLSQVELASALGVSKQCISNWENDYIQPSVEMLIKIAKYFNVTTDYLLGISDLKIEYANNSSLKFHNSSIEPPPLPIIITSTLFFLLKYSIPLIIVLYAPSP